MSGAAAACRAVIERLRLVLEEESAMLASPQPHGHATFTERKNQLLRDLLLAQRQPGARAALCRLRPEAAALRAALGRNQQLLEAHIAAVKDVSAIIVDAIRQAESDGTYSRFA